MTRIAKVLLCCTLLSPTVAQAVYEVGDTVGNFTLTDLDNNVVSLYDHAGEIIVLNFFTTWCPGCNEEAEALENEIWQVYQSQGVAVIGVDIMEPLPLVQGWAAANDVTYHIWLAPDWSLYQMFEAFGAIPYNTVIDPDMTLRYKEVGFNQTAIINWIETILIEFPTPIQASVEGAWPMWFHGSPTDGLLHAISSQGE
jgi:peroxiredoxin